MSTTIADQGTGRGQDLRAAPQGRKTKQQVLLGRAQPGLSEQRLEGHEIARGQGPPNAGLDLGVELQPGEQAVEEFGMADVELVAAKPGRLQAAGREGDHLGIRHRARGADQLRPGLVRLPAAGEAAGVVAEHGGGVAEPQGEG